MILDKNILMFLGEILKVRNIYAHNYEGIMHDVVWITMKEDIPFLKEYIESILI